MGGTINATTSFDSTVYTLSLPKGLFQQGLDIISDMLMNSAFDPQQVEKERQVIHGEMRLYNDRPERKLSDDVFKNVYIRHPYRHPIIGYPTLFDTITRDQLYEYYKSRYIPNNIILSVAGAVEIQDVMPLIQQTFTDFKPLPYPDRNLVPEPPQISSRYYEDFYPTPLFRFSLAYQSVAITDPDLYALDVLAMALGTGESSRFYTEIYKKKKLVQSISCSNFTPVDKGLFEVEGVMVKDHLQEVKDSVKAIITDIQQHGLTPAELDKTKRQVLSQFIFSNQTSASLAYRAASDEASTGDTRFSQHYVDAVKVISNEDIKRAAQRYLVDAALSVTVLKPKELGLGQEHKKQEIQKTAIQKLVLENGLTILLKEDHSVGVVAIDAVANAGIRRETSENNGISQLTASVWTKGTKTRSAQVIAQQMEERGGGVGGYAGRNTIGMKMNVLADDLPFALDLLADLIENPLFPEQDIQEAKENLYTAISAREDNIEQSTFKKLMETLFLQHPLRLDPLGSKDTLTKLSRKDLVDYYGHFIHPNNMVIAVFGDFDAKQAAAQLKAKFNDFKKAPVDVQTFHEPLMDKARFNVYTADKEQAVAMFGFQAPAIKDRDRWAMELIDTVLGSSLSGRLFVKIRDELGRAYTVGSDYIPGIDAGMIALFVLTTSDKVDSVKEIVIRQLQDIQTKGISEDELKSAKAYVKGNFKMVLDTPAALGTTSALDELYGLGYDFHEQFDGLIDAVSKEDIKRIAGQYLDVQKSAIVMTKGKSGKRP